MRMSNAFSAVVGTALFIGLTNAPSSAPATPVYAPLVADNTDFALNLYSQLETENPTNNIFFSPYSISTCFGMVYAGARGETALQMAEALDWSTNQDEIGPEFGALQAEVNAQQSTNGVSLNVANGLWAQTNFPFLPAFLDNASNNYEASVQQVDFITDAPQITDQINQWVAEKTEGVIPSLFGPGALKPTTRLTLVDAIYFKGGWQFIFDTNATRVAPFYVSPNQWVNAPMMERIEFARYYEDNFLQAVELPYTNCNVTMVVLLPKAGSPAVLTPAELSTALNGLAPAFVNVNLPRFKLEMTINLVPILESMGMVDAFSPYLADFSGIDGATDLSIDTAIHKAVVEVDETGTVAAAATGITVISTAVPSGILFQADHPFIFLIRDTTSDSILFMGRVDDPTTGSGTGITTSLPLIRTTDGNFGIRNHQFGFNVSATNATLVVEACTNIASGAWSPVRTLTLTNGSAYFSEPLPNCPTRFYRVHSP